MAKQFDYHLAKKLYLLGPNVNVFGVKFVQEAINNSDYYIPYNGAEYCFVHPATGCVSFTEKFYRELENEFT